MEPNFRMKRSYRGSKMGSEGKAEKEGNKMLRENSGVKMNLWKFSTPYKQWKNWQNKTTPCLPSTISELEKLTKGL